MCLHIQPALFPIKDKKEKVKSCCMKKDSKQDTKCPGTDKGCCDKSMCNPFFCTCPLCMANGVTVQGLTFLPNKIFPDVQPVFFSKTNDLLSNYVAEMLRPPQAA